MVLARHFISIGRGERALEVLREGDGWATGNPEAWMLRGRALVTLERHKDAVGVFERGLALRPEDTEMLYLLAYSEKMLGHIAAAERHLLQALRVAPHSAVLLSEYAALVARAGQFGKAHALLARAEQADPESPSVVRIRAFLATLEGRDREAVKHARALLAEMPDDANAHVIAAQKLLNVGRPEAGFRHAREAVTLDARVADDNKEWLRHQRMLSHWAMIPLRPIQRYGPAVIWGGAIALLFVLRSLGWKGAALGVALVYLAFVIYSWVVPPVVRWYLRRRFS